MRSGSARSAHRGLVLLASLALPVGLAAAGGHRGAHMVRSLLVPGAGLYGEAPILGVTLTVAAVAATAAWLRWGFDVGLLAVVALAVALSGIVPPSAHPTPQAATAPVVPELAAHQFPLVVLVIAWLGWARTVGRRLPPVARLTAWRHRRRTRPAGLGPSMLALGPVDRCRAASILALGDSLGGDERASVVDALRHPDLARRARRIGGISRGRLGGDPFRRDHAAARTAFAAWDLLTDDERRRLEVDAGRAEAGVPASEPTWVRLVDLVLAARFLGSESAIHAARHLLRTDLGLHRSHRPAWWWTPLGIGGGRATPWEHAASSALARDAGWIGDEDWAALRREALGAAARGSAAPPDERMIAAARLWLCHVDDPEASRILARPTVAGDPLAVALDRLATARTPQEQPT